MFNGYLERLIELSDLPTNWDGEEANPPNSTAIEKAYQIVEWLQVNSIKISEIDADVIGGIAIFLAHPLYEIWISCFNTGNNSLLVRDQSNVKVYVWSSNTQNYILKLYK